MVHGSEFEKLHEKMPPHLLPSLLGGTGPDLNPDSWRDEVYSAVGEGEDTAL